MAKDKDKAKNSGEVVSPWTDDSGPDILEIVNDPKNRDQLSPANLGELLTVHFLHLSCSLGLLEKS